MNSRRVLRRLRSKTAALLILTALAAVALVVPTLAGALDQPNITSPGAGVQNAGWDKTFTFATASDPDLSAAGYALLRGPDDGGPCDIAGAAPVASGPNTATTLADGGVTDGAYCYWVEASDGGGPPVLSDSMPVKVTYDGTPPPVSIDTAPGANSNDTTPTFTFSSSDGSATFECSVNGGGFSACSSPKTLTTQSEGSHSFAVKAIDAAGNHSTTAASDTWTVDTTAATASLDSTPGLHSNDQTPSFSFSSSEPTGATFLCKLDSAAYASCSSGITLSSLGDGSHTFAVKAIDLAGNVQATGTPYTWTVDTVNPTATIGTKPSSQSNDTTPTFTFSSSEPTGATFECSVDSGSFATCTSGITLSSLGDGGHMFAVKSIDQAGNHSTTAASYSWTVDTAAPVASIDAAPNANSSDSTPSFSFSSSEPTGATFECSVDGGGFTACTSPKTLGTQSDASHTFAVKAIDQAGNHSTSAASYTWTVDTVHPTATIGTKPASLSNVATPTFTFSSSEPTGATFECSVDGASFATCTSGITLGSLSDAAHTFAVKSIDLAGNHSTTAASYGWTVDTTPPPVTLGTTPPAFSNDNTPTFTFSSTDGGATFECQLDAGGYSACTTPKTYSTQTDGQHTFDVRAIDGASNHSTTAASYTWTVDTTPPPVTIDAQPAALSNTKTPAFSFSSSDSGATFECQIDGGGFTACTSPKTLSILSEASHTFAVKAIDTALNHTVTAASYTWSIDATNPTVPGSFQIVGAGTTRNGPPIFKFTQSTEVHPGPYSLLRDGVDTGASASLSGGFESMTDSNIIGDGTDDGVYHYTVQANDTYGNHSVTGEIVVTIDGGPPSVPANVHVAAALTRSAPVISWNASTGQPATYKVFRDGASIGTVTAPATTFSDATLPLDGTADRAYTYTVAAVDAAGNQSNASLGAQVVLDTLRPLPAASLMVTQSPTAAKPVLIWPASGSGDLAGYNVYRGGAKINGALVGTTTFTDAALDGDGSYAYTVRAVDNAGNESADSSGASVLYDTTAPGTPGASAVAAPSGGTATISWAAAGDAGAGVAAYQVRRSAANGGAPASLAEGTPICGSVPPTARGCSDVGLTPGASYHYSVFAIDAVGNVSAPGQTSTISIPSTTDKTPPKAPTALHALLSNGQITLSWKNPKSDLATVTVVWNSKRAPRTSRDGNLIYHGGGTKVSLKLPKLQAGKLMRFGVFAADRVGNVSVAARATVNVPQPSPVSLAPNGKLSGSPDLTWNAVTGATYYNVQVFEGTQAAKRVGIAWPAVTKYTLPGKDMKKGKVYTWYVWPGIGAKSSAKYGKLIGKVTFTYTG